MKKLLVISLTFIALALGTLQGNAATTYDWTGAISTDWGTPGNWKIGAAVATTSPGNATNDVVRIGSSVAYASGNDPVLGTAVTVGAVTIGSVTTAALTVNGILTCAALNVKSGSSLTSTANINATTLTITGGTATLGATTSLSGALAVTGGLNVNGPLSCTTIVVNSGSTVTSNASGTISATGTITITASTFNLAAAFGTTNSSTSAFKFSSGTTSFTNSAPVNITAGSMVVTGAVTLNAATNVQGTLKFLGAAGSTLDIQAPFTSVGAITISSGNTITSNSSGTITASAITVTSGTFDVSAAVNVAGTLTSTGSITSHSGGVIQAATLTETGSLSVADSLIVSGALTFNTGSTIVSSAGGKIITGSLVTSNSTFTLADDITITGTGTALNFKTGTNLINNTSSAINVPNGDMILTAGTATIGAPTTVSGAVAVAGILNINAPFTSGAITVSSSKTITSAAGGTINASSITLTATNTLTLNDAINVTGDITINGTGACTIVTNATGSTIGSITQNVAGETLNLNTSGTGLTSVATLNISSKSDVNVASGDTVVFGSVNMTAGTGTGGNTSKLTNNGTVSCSGTVSIPVYSSIINSATGVFNLGPASVVNLTASTASVANSGTFTLLSDATGSATIGAITAGASLTGTYIVQRFITGGSLAYRGYRLLSSPVHSGATGFYDLAFLSGSGSYLTGAASGGFDATGNPTIYLYREDMLPSNASFTAGNYRAITAINNSPLYNLGTIDGNYDMPVGNGFLFFYRGNNGTNTSTIPNSLTFNTTGTLNQGQITVNNWVTGLSNLAYSTTSGSLAVEGFNLVGNPYPSSIDWNTAYNNVTSTTGIYAPNTDQTIYIYNTTSKNYDTYINTGPGTGIGTNGMNNIIPAGQGFFVHAINASAQLIFNETAKVTAQPAVLLLNATTPAIDRHLRLQLKKDDINKDETVLVFNNDASTVYVKHEDALYLKGTGPVSISNKSSDNTFLAVNQLPFPKQSQAIPLNVTVKSSGTYQLNLTEASNIPKKYDVWLKDAFINDSLDIKHNPTYSFNVTGDAATSGAARFSLVIRPNSAYAEHLLSFTATKAANDVKLAWTTENEENDTRFVIERSTDGGTSFKGLDSLTSTGAGAYNGMDQHPASGLNQYRLKQVAINGDVSYSNIANVTYSAVEPTYNIVKIAPNPVVTTIHINIAVTDLPGARYKMTIINSSGRIVKTIISPKPWWVGDISRLLPGTYFVQVVNEKTNEFIGRNSFIKL